MAAAVDDFYQARTYPDSFDFNAMPEGWQRAQRILCAEYEKLQFQTSAKLLKKIERM